MEHLAATSKNTDKKGRAKHIVLQMESLSFVAFCHFLHDLFSKLSLTLQRNSLILPQAVAAVESCLETVKKMKEKALREGKLEEFLQHIGKDFEGTEKQKVLPVSKRQRAASNPTVITFKNVELKGPQSHVTFTNDLNAVIDKTVDITLKELERRFGNMLMNVTEKGPSKGSEVIRAFSVFCHDAWPEDAVTYGEEQVDTLVNWYKQWM